jgi:hypothetical protein
MKKIILSFLAILHTAFSFGQSREELQKIADDIMSKATLIYELESAAWIATDTVMTRPGFNKKEIEGYVCYKANEITLCIFYNKENTVVAEASFSNGNHPQITYVKRPSAPVELDLITIKRTIIDKISKKQIKQFRIEPNTTYNLVPIIINNENYCYLINAISDTTKTILGRDCRIKLDNKGIATEVTYNHKSLQYLPFNVKDVQAFYHTHVLDNFFLETEIATTLLYKNYLPTDQFMVMGRKFTFTWNTTTMSLTIK